MIDLIGSIMVLIGVLGYGGAFLAVTIKEWIDDRTNKTKS